MTDWVARPSDWLDDRGAAKFPRARFARRMPLGSPAPILAFLRLGFAALFGLAGCRAPVCEGCNLVLVSLDTLRADRLGSYGYTRNTSPGIDALADRSFVFLNAIAQFPSTPESHRSLFTGRYAFRGGRAPTLAQILRQQGYRTAGFTGGGFVHRRFGLAGGFEHYYDEVEYNGLRDITPRLLTWLREGRNAPFFLFIHTYDIHCPYTPPEPYFSMFAGDYRPDFELEGKCGLNFFNQRALSAADVEFISAVYDGGVRWVDHMVEKLLAEFDALGLNEDTIFVITSDHGEALGENGFFGHGRLSEEQIRVPLILRVPGARPQRIREPVQLVDVLPTALALLGIEPPPNLDGVDLTPILRGDFSFEGRRPRLTMSQPGDLAFRVDDTWLLILRRSTGEKELYNLSAASRRDVSAAHVELTTSLEKELREIVRPRALRPNEAERRPDFDDLDPRLVEQLRALGYAE